MALTRSGSHGLTRTRSLLNSLIELPDLPRTIQELPAQTFAALIRKVGVEDSGELVALATTEQLVRAFDEDLFVSERPGERESLDVGRFIVWLEVLLEAGDEVAAQRIAELDEDFVAHALGGVLVVVAEDALRDRLDSGDEDEARLVDKSLESALTEELDGYLLIARRHDGWDAAISLVLALDRDHRALLERLLDRLANVGSTQLDDLEAFSTLLSEGESLAEDAEAAREERRSQHGYVEARAAHAFLALARQPPQKGAPVAERDPLTRAYFRDLARKAPASVSGTAASTATASLPPAVLRALDGAAFSGARAALPTPSSRPRAVDAFTEALRQLGEDDPMLFGERMEEFAYIANVLIAGFDRDGARLRPGEAADAALATVCYGAVTAFWAAAPKTQARRRPTAAELADVLRRSTVDLLFRLASSALTAGAAPNVATSRASGLLDSPEALEVALR